MKSPALRALAIAATSLVASAGHANLLQNGGFEVPALGANNFATYNSSNEPATFVWQVNDGTIDHANGNAQGFVLFGAYEGAQYVDLNGNERGSLFQDFTTVAGQRYVLTFAFADNPIEGGTSTAGVSVTNLVDSSALLSGSISHSTSANSIGGADWTLYSANFVAASTSTRLSFTSTSASNSPSGGVLLDAVSVDPDDRTDVPAPAGVTLLGAALALLLRRQLPRGRPGAVG